MEAFEEFLTYSSALLTCFVIDKLRDFMPVVVSTAQRRKQLAQSVIFFCLYIVTLELSSFSIVGYTIVMSLVFSVIISNFS